MKHIALLVLALPLFAKQPPELRLDWTDLNSAIRRHEVVIPLPDGTEARGNVETVTADAIIFHGRREVPRASVSRLQLIQIRGHKRWLGIPLGYYLMGVAISAASRSNGEVLQGLPGLAPIAAGVAGYFVGRHFDRRVTWILIAPAIVPHQEPAAAKFIAAVPQN